jgi:hypothetical protein
MKNLFVTVLDAALMAIIAIACLLICLSGLAALAGAQTGLLATGRYDANWPQAGATIPTGTIPPCSTQPSTGSASAVNAAFTADAGGTSYCQLNIPAGAFTGSQSLVLAFAGRANVVVNGAGPNSTFYVFNGTPSSGCNGLGPAAVCVWNGDNSTNAGENVWPNKASVTSTLSQGSTTLTLSQIGVLKVGSLLQIAQPDSATDNGNAWFCGTTGFTGACTQIGSYSEPRVNGVNYSQTQLFVVTGCGATTYGASCTSNTIVLNDPVKLPNWASTGVLAWWPNTLPITNVGIQNISIDTSGASNQYMIECHDCANVWFTGDRTINAIVTGQSATNHYLMWQNAHVTVARSYMYGSNPASEGYGVTFGTGTSSSQAESNISQKIASGYLVETGAGNVFDYNYAVDNYFGSNWQQCELFNHAAGSYYGLFEGNVGICYTSDNYQGNDFASTLYRNYLSGLDPAVDAGGARMLNTHAIICMEDCRYDNYFANVLGTTGYHTVYQDVGLSGTPNSCPGQPTPNIYSIGFGNQNQEPQSPSCYNNGGSITWTLDNDTLSSTTMARWGNYDVVNLTVRELSSETASGLPVFAGLASPSTNFPSSFIYTSRPSWWNFSPWPGIGPDIQGGGIAGVAGHANLNPAANCYLDVMGGGVTGSTLALAYNPTQCYGTVIQTAAPQPPTSFKVSLLL